MKSKHAMPKLVASKLQTTPSTPASKAETKTSRPAMGRKIEGKPAAQPAPQNVKRNVGVKK
jgi:hypothetical protein